MRTAERQAAEAAERAAREAAMAQETWEEVMLAEVAGSGEGGWSAEGCLEAVRLDEDW